MTLDVLETARDWLAAGESVALASVVETWGSSPVPVGGWMVIASETRFHGSVSGGCVEADVIAEAADIIASGIPKLLRFGVTDETAWRAGLPCGGSIAILLQRIAPEDGLALLDSVLAARHERRPIAIRTRLEDGRLEVVPADSKSDLAGREVALGTLAPSRASASGGVIVQAVLPEPRVVVVGATHIAQHLVAIAGLAGYQTHVIDPRQSFASPTRWTGSDPATAWPGEGLAAIGLDPLTAVVALSHVAQIDDEALEAALDSQASYIGALGSARNHARRVERLKQKGFVDEDIARIHAPVGLDIGARTPPEIALAIMAEIVLAFRGPRRS